MAAVAFRRAIDELGRIVIPMELRKRMHIREKDLFEVSIDNGRIILEKSEPSDVFTGESDELIHYGGLYVSKSSIVKLAELAGMTVSTQE